MFKYTCEREKSLAHAKLLWSISLILIRWKFSMTTLSYNVVAFYGYFNANKNFFFILCIQFLSKVVALGLANINFLSFGAYMHFWHYIWNRKRFYQHYVRSQEKPKHGEKTPIQQTPTNWPKSDNKLNCLFPCLSVKCKFPGPAKPSFTFSKRVRFSHGKQRF